ncbi:Type II pantothenate kinase [Arabidopsis thaliana x Arabidopsis arenosa]|uniref:Type II pantothenate kinase n=1 Tax=Arabidopsis thaliana x Arabidopsis arenosa TaxID=1240361 RepID=A0A8T1ZMQ5_9BRAS|nr:Type II pantothenate kinase [Arabidopsis thaliana x Arabidopsis arenosa]
MEGEKEFVQIDPNDLYPYLLVNVGSGVSIIKVFVYIFYFFQKLCIWLPELHGPVDFMQWLSNYRLMVKGKFERVSGTNVGGGMVPRVPIGD